MRDRGLGIAERLVRQRQVVVGLAGRDVEDVVLGQVVLERGQPRRPELGDGLARLAAAPVAIERDRQAVHRAGAAVPRGGPSVQLDRLVEPADHHVGLGQVALGHRAAAGLAHGQAVEQHLVAADGGGEVLQLGGEDGAVVEQVGAARIERRDLVEALEVTERLARDRLVELARVAQQRRVVALDEERQQRARQPVVRLAGVGVGRDGRLVGPLGAGQEPHSFGGDVDVDGLQHQLVALVERLLDPRAAQRGLFGLGQAIPARPGARRRRRVSERAGDEQQPQRQRDAVHGWPRRRSRSMASTWA